MARTGAPVDLGGVISDDDAVQRGGPSSIIVDPRPGRSIENPNGSPTERGRQCEIAQLLRLRDRELSRLHDVQTVERLAAPLL